MGWGRPRKQQRLLAAEIARSTGTLDESHFSFQPSIDKRLIEGLATLHFVGYGIPIRWSANSVVVGVCAWTGGHFI